MSTVPVLPPPPEEPTLALIQYQLTELKYDIHRGFADQRAANEAVNARIDKVDERVSVLERHHQDQLVAHEALAQRGKRFDTRILPVLGWVVGAASTVIIALFEMQVL